MKNYRLSSPSERTAGLCISAIMLLCMVVLVMILRNDPLSFIICLLCCLLVVAGLGLYVANLLKTACVPHPANRTLTVKGFPDYTVDLSDAVSLETAAYKNGPLASRTLVFANDRGEVTAAIPTFFTANQGAQAEPLARELAEVLGLTFKPSLEIWEYDKQARKEHQKQLALEEKTARKEKFRALKAKILRMTGAGTPAPVITEEESSDGDDMEFHNSDGINFDALDDEK